MNEHDFDRITGNTLAGLCMVVAVCTVLMVGRFLLGVIA